MAGIKDDVVAVQDCGEAASQTRKNVKKKANTPSVGQIIFKKELQRTT